MLIPRFCTRRTQGVTVLYDTIVVQRYTVFRFPRNFCAFPGTIAETRPCAIQQRSLKRCVSANARYIVTYPKHVLTSFTRVERIFDLRVTLRDTDGTCAQMRA